MKDGGQAPAIFLPSQARPPPRPSGGARVDAQGSPPPGPSLHSPPLIAFQLYV